MMRRTWFLFLAVAVALAGCLAPVGENGPQRTGLTVVINGGARNLLPPISMDVAQYRILLAGPSTVDPVTVASSQGTVNFPGLLPGNYTVTVEGLNADSTKIAEGSNTAEVVIGTTAQCSVLVEELSGNGSYLLDIAWEPDIVDDPHFYGTLDNGAGTVVDQSFDLNLGACTGQSLVDPVARGWYLNIVQLWDGEQGDPNAILSTGFADMVRVAAGYQTHGDVFLHAVQGKGILDVLIDLSMVDPLELIGTPAEGTVEVWSGDLLTVAATEAEGVPFSGAWYVNGTLVGSGGTYQVDADDYIDDEYYRLDFCAWATDGSGRAGAAHWTIDKPAVEELVSIGGSLNPAGFVGQDLTLIALQKVGADLVPQRTRVFPITSADPFDYVVPNLPAGDYYLRVEASGGYWGYWWSTDNMVKQGAPASPNIVIPHAEGVVYNITAIQQ